MSQHTPASPTSSIVLGLWPIAGVTTVGVTLNDARATIAAAIDCGLYRFDTAFSYGYQGESDRLLGEFVRPRRDQFHITGKVGQRWNDEKQRVLDGNPRTLIADAETSLSRIGIDHFDILMLHSPDPDVPIERSADAIFQLHRRGLCRQIGASHLDEQQLDRFMAVAPCHFIQCPLNLLQRQSVETLIPAAEGHGCEVAVFWTLMKGLLAGQITREHEFAPGDSRPEYDIFQGDMRRRAHDILDRMQKIAEQQSLTIPQLSIGWALAQPGVDWALVGARRADQVVEISKSKRLSDSLISAIDEIVDSTI